MHQRQQRSARCIVQNALAARNGQALRRVCNTRAPMRPGYKECIRLTLQAALVFNCSSVPQHHAKRIH